MTGTELVLAAAVVLALGALITAAWLHHQLAAMSKLAGNLLTEVTDLHRARRRDRADLNRLFRWAHGADPNAEPSSLTEPDPDVPAIPPPPDVPQAPPLPWAPREDLPDPPDRRTRERRTTAREPDRRTTGAHRSADATTEMPRQPSGGHSRIDEHPEKEAVYPSAPERPARP